MLTPAPPCISYYKQKKLYSVKCTDSYMMTLGNWNAARRRRSCRDAVVALVAPALLSVISGKLSLEHRALEELTLQDKLKNMA